MNFKKNVEKKIYNKFHKTYVLKTNILYKKFIIENLISTKECHKVACLKDCMIYDYVDEFLKRYYKKNESKSHIPKFVNYYKNYLTFFCKPTFSSITFNNIIQNNGEKKAEIYYHNNYGNKKKNSHKKDDSIKKFKNIFSESIKESINDITSFNENDKTINLNNSNFSRYIKKKHIFLDESESNSIYNLLMNLNNNKKNANKRSIKTERLSLNKRILNDNFNNNIIAIDKVPDEIHTHSSRKNTFYNSNSKISNVSNSHNNYNNNHIHIIAENKTIKNKSRNLNNNILFKMNSNNIEINKNPLFISQPHLIYTITQTNNFFSPNSLNKNKIKIKAQNKKINSISPPKININENTNSHRRSNSNLIKLKEKNKLNKESKKFNNNNNFNNINQIITSFNNFETQQKILNNGKNFNYKNNINCAKTFSPNKFSSNSSINTNTTTNFNSNRKIKPNFKLTQNKIHLKLSSNNKLTKVIKLNYK